MAIHLTAASGKEKPLATAELATLRAVSGWIFNIQRFSLQDGPGIRTTVFFKGCPLRCQWCHNPEGVNPQPELFFDPQSCIGCGRCLAVCPTGAQHLDSEGQRVLERSKCRGCGRCAAACPARALEKAGEERNAGEIFDIIWRDRAFYANSGGGVTLSGGEPLRQPRFAEALLRLCQAKGLATAVETCVQVPWAVIARVAPRVDLWLCDLKHVDAEKHRRFTGADNRRILAHLERMAAQGWPLQIRVPVIPGFNDTVAEFQAIGDFLRSLGHPQPPPVELIPYHRFGEGKYHRLGRPYPLEGTAELTTESLAPLREALQAAGVPEIKS